MSDVEDDRISIPWPALRRLLRLSRELHTAAIRSRPERLIAGVGDVLSAAVAASTAVSTAIPAAPSSAATAMTTLATTPAPDGLPCGPVPDLAFAGPPAETVRDVAGGAHRLTSILRDGERTSALVCWRGSPFTAAEAALLALLHAEFGWVIDAAGLVAELPPENRVVLELLRTGMREKQIARRLERSQHTVHSHIKRLYRRFAVSSRAELLAKLASQEHGEV